MFQRGIDVKEFGDKLLNRTMYSGVVLEEEEDIKQGGSHED